MGHFRASGMGRIVACPGSYRIEKQQPDKSGAAAKLGTFAAAVAARCLLGGGPLSNQLGYIDGEHIVDADMIHHLALYVDHVREELGHPVIEAPMSMEICGHTLSGTPDAWGSTADRLTVTDLKYGHGWVEAEDNWQLLSYALLVNHMSGWYGWKSVRLEIVQPRANHPDGPIRAHEFHGDLLRNEINILKGAMDAACMDGAPTRTGPHCRYCRGLLGCNTAEQAASYTLDIAGTNGSQPVGVPEALAHMELIALAAKRLEHRRVALEEFIMTKASQGEPVPGYEYRQTVGPLAWNMDPQAVIDAATVFGADVAQPANPVTPTQVINRKLLPPETVKALASRKSGGMKLTKINLKRIRRLLK